MWLPSISSLVRAPFLFLTFHFEVIIDSQEVSNIKQTGPVCPLSQYCLAVPFYTTTAETLVPRALLAHILICMTALQSRYTTVFKMCPFYCRGSETVKIIIQMGLLRLSSLHCQVHKEYLRVWEE